MYQIVKVLREFGEARRRRQSNVRGLLRQRHCHGLQRRAHLQRGLGAESLQRQLGEAARVMQRQRGGIVDPQPSRGSFVAEERRDLPADPAEGQQHAQRDDKVQSDRRERALEREQHHGGDHRPSLSLLLLLLLWLLSRLQLRHCHVLLTAAGPM